MGSFSVIIHSHVDGVTAKVLPPGKCGEVLVMIINNNPDFTSKPRAVYFIPEGIGVKVMHDCHVFPVPEGCSIVFGDIVQSEALALEVGKKKSLLLQMSGQGIDVEPLCC